MRVAVLTTSSAYELEKRINEIIQMQNTPKNILDIKFGYATNNGCGCYSAMVIFAE